MTGIALLVFGCLASTAGGQQVAGTLRVMTGRAEFRHHSRSGADRHAVSLKLLVEPGWLPELHDPEAHHVRVVVGATDLVEVAAGEGRYRVGKNRRWRYRRRDERGRVKINANPLNGKLKISVSRASLPDLRASDAEDLPVVVEMAEHELVTTASFAVKDGRVRRWRGLAQKFVPAPGPGPDPGGDPEPVAFSVLRKGIDSLLFPRVHQVARTENEWLALWQKHAPGATPPFVDFGRDMAIGVFLGLPTKSNNPGFTSTIRIVSVTDSTTRREVVWEEVPNDIAWFCPPPGVGAPCILPDPYEVVLAPATTLPVFFRPATRLN